METSRCCRRGAQGQTGAQALQQRPVQEEEQQQEEQQWYHTTPSSTWSCKLRPATQQREQWRDQQWRGQLQQGWQQLGHPQA